MVNMLTVRINPDCPCCRIFEFKQDEKVVDTAKIDIACVEEYAQYVSELIPNVHIVRKDTN